MNYLDFFSNKTTLGQRMSVRSLKLIDMEKEAEEETDVVLNAQFQVGRRAMRHSE